MKVVVQKVSMASCEVDNKLISKINSGLLVYVGFTNSDTNKDIIKIASKLKNLRIFEDSNNKLNLSIKDTLGSFLIISQFTLYSNSKKGNRPSFTNAASYDYGLDLYQKFIMEMEKDFKVETGIYGENMKITSTNSGPVTLIIETLEGEII